MGSASAADFFLLHIRLYLIWFWADMVCGIGFAVQIGCGLHISQVKLFDFEFPVFSTVCSSFFDWLVLYCDTYLMYLMYFEATKKLRNENPCNMTVKFRLDLLWGPDW